MHQFSIPVSEKSSNQKISLACIHNIHNIHTSIHNIHTYIHNIHNIPTYIHTSILVFRRIFSFPAVYFLPTGPQGGRSPWSTACSMLGSCIKYARGRPSCRRGWKQPRTLSRRKLVAPLGAVLEPVWAERGIITRPLAGAGVRSILGIRPWASREWAGCSRTAGGQKDRSRPCGSCL